MKHYLLIAFRQIKTERIPSIFIILSFFVSAFMLASLITAVPMVQKISQQQFTQTQGNFHIRIGTEEPLKELKTNDDFEAVGQYSHLGIAPIAKSGMMLSIEHFDKTARDMWPHSFDLLEGRYPEIQGEIALEKRDFKALGIPEKLGQKINLEITYFNKKEKERREYTVCGILDNYRRMEALGGHLGLVSDKEASENKYTDENYFIRLKEPKKLQKEEYLALLKEQYGISSYKTNDYLLQSYYIFPAGADKSEFYKTWIPFLLVAGITLFACGLVIYNVLKIFMLKNMSQFGTMRTLGASKGQIYEILFFYLFLLLLPSLLGGIVLGGLSAKVIAVLAAANWRELLTPSGNAQTLEQLIDGVDINSGMTALATTIVLLLFIFAATMPVLYEVTSISPVAALSGWKNKIRIRKRHKSRAREIKSINRYLAFLNMQRNRSRSIITILSMIISVMAVIGITTYFNMKEMQQQYNVKTQGDYIFTAPVGVLRDLEPEQAKEALETGGFTKEELSNLKEELENCIIISQMFFTLPYGYGGDTEKFPKQSGKITLFGADGEGLSYLAPDLPDKAIRKLEEGNGVLYYRLGKENFTEESWEQYVNYAIEGDILTIAGNKYEILYDMNYEPDARWMASFNAPYGCTHLYMEEKEFCRVLGINEPRYAQLSVLMNENADVEAVQKTINAFKDSHSDAGFMDLFSSRQKVAEEMKKEKAFGYLLAFLVALVGVFNLVSTIYTGIHTRIKETGLLRALGMERKSLEKCFLWEGALYGIIASFFSFFGGVILSWSFVASFIGKHWMHEDVLSGIPGAVIIVLCLLTIFICLLSTWIAIRKICKMNITASLEFME